MSISKATWRREKPRPRLLINFRLAALLAMAIFNVGLVAHAAETFTVKARPVSDPKAVFATVESTNVVPARARIGGTVVAVNIKAGDRVESGTVVAVVSDEKFALQIKALDAEISGLTSERDKAATDLSRAKELFDKGTVARSRLDETQTALDVAIRALESRSAQRSVIEQQIAEGSVFAPAAGRVLEVPVTVGTVILQGEAIAQIAEENYVLRLRVPERHARSMRVGDAVRLDPDGHGDGRIVLVYPKIEDGRVVADALVDRLGDYFVGERVRVWVASEPRPAFVVPTDFVVTRFGVDYVAIARSDGPPFEAPIQRGQALALPGQAGGVEILSGVKDGDVLVHP